MQISIKVKILISLVLVFLAVISVLFVAPAMGRESTLEGTIQSLDEKISSVLKLAGASTATSAAITLLPGDVATPIASQLAELADYFLLVLCVLLAEKYLGPIIMLGFFRYLIPVLCILGIILLFTGSKGLKQLIVKAGVTGFAMLFLVPASIGISDLIYRNYRESIETTISNSEQLTEESNLLSESNSEQNLIEQAISSISQSATALAKKASTALTNFTEMLAVFVVTSCIIPVLVLVLFIWLIKMVTGLDISVVRPNIGRAAHNGAKALKDKKYGNSETFPAQE